MRFTVFFFNVQHNFYCKDTSSPLLSAHKQDLLAGNNLKPKGQLDLKFPQLDPGSFHPLTSPEEILPQSKCSCFSLPTFQGGRERRAADPCQCKAALKGIPSGKREDAPSHPIPSPSSCTGSMRNHLPSLSGEEFSPPPGMPGQESLPSWLSQCFSAEEIKQSHELGPKHLLTGILFEKIRF